MTPPEPGKHARLDEELALDVRELSKTYDGSHEARYVPAVSLFALLRERRGATHAGRRQSDADELEDEEDDDDDEDEGLPPRDELSSFHDLSFQLRRGEAVGIIGHRPGVTRTVARVLCGMTAPSAGRILVRGRVAPSVELADLLTRRETNARSAAMALAVLAGPGRRQRREYVESILALALGDDVGSANLARAPKDLLRQIAVAAALDPFADVLVIDERPSHGDSNFRERWFKRLAERLAEGAAAVVISDDEEILRLCESVIRLEGERASDLAPPRSDESDRDDAGWAGATRLVAVPGFNAHAAILAVAAVDSDGLPVEVERPDAEVRVRALFETVVRADVLLVVRFLGDATYRFDRPKETLRPGTHVVLLRLPPTALEPGDYELAMGLVMWHGGERTKIGRKRVARLRVEADELGLAFVAETGSGQPSADRGHPVDPKWTLETVPV